MIFKNNSKNTNSTTLTTKQILNLLKKLEITKGDI